jgi:hypothetical protein
MVLTGFDRAQPRRIVAVRHYAVAATAKVLRWIKSAWTPA